VQVVELQVGARRSHVSNSTSQRHLYRDKSQSA
jgi:hypothetical protein